MLKQDSNFVVGSTRSST